MKTKAQQTRLGKN